MVRQPRARSMLADLACQPSGLHWHQLVDPYTGKPMQVAFAHYWTRASGHPTSPDPHRPHQHVWSEAQLTDALRHLGIRGPMLHGLVRELEGMPRDTPSTAHRPGGVTEWLGSEEAVALTLHPELRPPRLRDA